MHNIDAPLEDYLSSLREQGVLEEVGHGLSAYYEPARAILGAGDRPLVFSVKGHRCVANLVASRTLLYQLLGASSDREAYRRLLAAESTPGRLVEKRFNEYFEETGYSLEELPAIKFYERDGGRYITSSVFVACVENTCNASIHRVMVSSEGYVAVRIVPRHLYRMLGEAGGRLPVAFFTGAHPLVVLASALSPPYGVFELGIAASLLGGGLGVCKTPLHGLPVPCGAGYVVEGVLGPERKREGPFVDLLGLYDRVREEPVLHVERIYVNKAYKPYFHVILPGGAEHMMLMGFPREAQVYDAVSRAVAGVVKVRLTRPGGMWLHAVVSIKKTHDGDGKTAGFAALAAHPSLKHVVVVDDDIDPDDPSQVEWAIAVRLQASRGIIVARHARGSTLDPSSEEGLTDKLIVDATMPLKSREKYVRPRIPLEGEAG